MKKIGLVISAILFAILGYNLFNFGLKGIRTNLAGDSLINCSWDSLYSDSESKLYHYVKVSNAYLIKDNLVYNDRYNKTTKVISPVLKETDIQELNNGKKVNVRIFAEFSSRQEENSGVITGIADKIDADEKKDIRSLDNSSFSIDESAIIIRANQNPRKWYWNLLMMVIPLLYMIGFTRAIVNIFRGKSIGIPNNKI